MDNNLIITIPIEQVKRFLRLIGRAVDEQEMSRQMLEQTTASTEADRRLALDLSGQIIDALIIDRKNQVAIEPPPVVSGKRRYVRRKK